MHSVVPNELLYTIAQVGSAFAGFSTIVAAVGNRGFTTNQVVSIVILSLLVVFFSLVPNLPFFDLESDGGWRTASGLYFVAWMSYWVYVMQGFRTNRYDVGFGDMSLPNKLNAFVTHPISILALLSSCLGAFDGSTNVVYSVCLLVMLGLAGFLFVQLTTTLVERGRETQRGKLDDS